MKKGLFLIALLAVVMCFTACSANQNPDGNDDSTTDIYLTLVNKTHQLPEDWEDMIVLKKVKNCFDEEVQIEQETYKQFQALRDDLFNQGIQIELDSVYRSVLDQEELWNYFTEEYGENYAETYLAAPGCSEHHTGMAVDIFLVKDGKAICDNEEMIADREDFEIIHKTMPKYGFIVRYPEGRDDVTGYTYEPWHMRYVGSADIAEEITDQHLTLEEYLNEID